MDSNIRQLPPANSSDILEGVKRQTVRAINCIKVGTIQSFDPATQLANIALSMKQVVSETDTGVRTLQEYPLLMECPVIVLFGGNDFLSMPVTVGDSCLVLFNDNELEQWLYNGEGQTPMTFRAHDLSDAIALVGIRSLTNSIVGYLANGIRLSHGNGNSTLDLKTDLIETVATLFLHNGNMEITGNAEVGGNLAVAGNFSITGTTTGTGGTVSIDSNVTLSAGRTLTAPVVNSGNGATGTFSAVTVANGIVTGGTP